MGGVTPGHSRRSLSDTVRRSTTPARHRLGQLDETGELERHLAGRGHDEGVFGRHVDPLRRQIDQLTGVSKTYTLSWCQLLRRLTNSRSRLANGWNG